MKNPLHILLVDDDEIANHLHKLLIEDLKIADQIDVASDGEEAFELIRRKYDLTDNNRDILILMDINMPGMDAFEFLEVFKSHYSKSFTNLHIALLSSSLNWKDQEKAKKFDIDEYLSKPLTQEKLHALIEMINKKNQYSKYP